MARVTAALVVTSAIAFVWLFGSGAVFEHDAGEWATAKAIVQTRVLGEDLVLLRDDPEEYVATFEGESDYLRLMDERGLVLRDRLGGGMLFRDRDGEPCMGSVEMFTANLNVYTAPSC